MHHADDIVSAVHLAETLGDRCHDLAWLSRSRYHLNSCDVVALLIFDEVRGHLHVLRYDQVLVFEDLGVLR